jgi:hypothetical protein
MTSKAVYTAIADDYNVLRDHPDVGTDVDWVAFVTHPQKYEASNWDVRPLFSYGEPNARRQAKWYKVQSLLEMAEYDRTLWIDGSCEIVKPYIVHILLECELPFAAYRHIDRDCAYQEAGFSLGMNKYRDEPLREQAQYYVDEYDHPERWGLWFTGVLVRNRCALVERIERAWWSEIDRFSYQDQVSLPVALRSVGYGRNGSLKSADGVTGASLPQKGFSSFVFHHQPMSQ